MVCLLSKFRVENNNMLEAYSQRILKLAREFKENNPKANFYDFDEYLRNQKDNNHA